MEDNSNRLVLNHGARRGCRAPSLQPEKQKLERFTTDAELDSYPGQNWEFVVLPDINFMIGAPCAQAASC